jgi:hypothetical protein
MAGHDEVLDSGFICKASANIFDDPDVKKVIEVKIRLDMFVIEAFPDLIKGLLQLSPSFKNIILEGDLVNLG